MPVKVACFSMNYPPLRDAEAYVSSKWVMAMRARGHSVEVFAANPEFKTPGLPPLLVSYLMRQWPRKYGTFDIRECLRLDRYVSHALPSFLAQHQRQPFDIIVSRYEPAGSVVAAYLAHERTGLPWLASINDPMPRHAAIRSGPRGVVDRQRNAFQEVWARRVLVQADSFVFPTERLRDAVVSRATRMGIAAEKFLRQSAVIPHIGGPGVSAATPKPLACSADNGKLVMRHIGYLGPSRDPITLLQALERLDCDSSSPLLVFEFVGAVGTHRRTIESFRERLKRVEIRTCAEVDAECAFGLMRASAVCVVIERPGPESPFLPSKFCDYAAAGRPILAITSAQSAAAEYLNEFGGGIAVDHGHPDAVADALRTLLGRHDSISQSLQDQFRPEEIVRKWEKIGAVRRFIQ